MIDVERLESGAVTVLRFEGEMDESGMNTVRMALMKCIQDQRYNVVLNLSAVTYVSYMGAGVLVERLTPFRAFGGDLKLVGLNLYLKRLLRMMGVKDVFDVFESEPQAIQTYRTAA